MAIQVVNFGTTAHGCVPLACSGHLAAFAALKLVEGRAARREVLDVMYSRGIDPMLLDPSLCHDHPEVPAQWPALPALRHYVRETRETTLRFLDTEEPLKGNDDSEVREQIGPGCFLYFGSTVALNPLWSSFADLSA